MKFLKDLTRILFIFKNFHFNPDLATVDEASYSISRAMVVCLTLGTVPWICRHSFLLICNLQALFKNDNFNFQWIQNRFLETDKPSVDKRAILEYLTLSFNNEFNKEMKTALHSLWTKGINDNKITP